MIREKEITKQKSLLNAVIMCDAVMDTYSNGFSPDHFNVDKYGDIHETINNIRSMFLDVYNSFHGEDAVPETWFHYDSGGSCMIVRAGAYHVVFFHTENNELGICPVKKSGSLEDDWYKAIEHPMNMNSATWCGFKYDMNKYE